MSKTIIITGATGLIGKKLTKALHDRNDKVIIFSRDSRKTKSHFAIIKEFMEWDYHKPEKLKSKIENVDMLVHLAGVN